ncbi:unnamed protein product [Chrysoparadoxa australica]
MGALAGRGAEHAAAPESKAISPRPQPNRLTVEADGTGLDLQSLAAALPIPRFPAGEGPSLVERDRRTYDQEQAARRERKASLSSERKRSRSGERGLPADEGETSTGRELRRRAGLDADGDASLAPPLSETSRPRTAGRTWEAPSAPTDDEIIARTFMSRAHLTAALSHRLTHIRIIKRLWSEGDIGGLAKHLRSLEEEASNLAIISDFLGAVGMAHKALSLEQAMLFTPLLEGLLRASQEAQVAVGLRCCKDFVSTYGSYIHLTRRAQVQGVDLAAAERQERCDKCHELFLRLRLQAGHVEREFYKDLALQEEAASLSQQLRHFLK